MYRWVPSPEVPAGQLDALGLRQAWEHQEEAEDWLTGTYPELLDAGVTAVSLVEEDRVVYGPMSLQA